MLPAATMSGVRKLTRRLSDGEERKAVLTGLQNVTERQTDKETKL